MLDYYREILTELSSLDIDDMRRDCLLKSREMNLPNGTYPMLSGMLWYQFSRSVGIAGALLDKLTEARAELALLRSGAIDTEVQPIEEGKEVSC